VRCPFERDWLEPVGDVARGELSLQRRQRGRQLRRVEDAGLERLLEEPVIADACRVPALNVQ